MYNINEKAQILINLLSDFTQDSTISTATTVTPSDTTDLTTPSKWLYIGVSGDVEVILTGGQTVIFRNLAVGFYPICATRIKAAGTTALNIIAGW